MKACSKCGIKKEEVDFYRYSGKSTLMAHCKICDNTLHKEWRKAHPEKTKEILYRSYLKHREKRTAYARKWAKDNPLKHSASQRRQTFKFKISAFAAYGGNRCSCCGESEISFLGIDHINGGGIAHRKITGAGSLLYRWLRKNGYPEGYRVLCHNCNLGRSINGGVCPHISKIVRKEISLSWKKRRTVIP